MQGTAQSLPGPAVTLRRATCSRWSRRETAAAPLALKECNASSGLRLDGVQPSLTASPAKSCIRRRGKPAAWRIGELKFSQGSGANSDEPLTSGDDDDVEDDAQTS